MFEQKKRLKRNAASIGGKFGIRDGDKSTTFFPTLAKSFQVNQSHISLGTEGSTDRIDMYGISMVQQVNPNIIIEEKERYQMCSQSSNSCLLGNLETRTAAPGRMQRRSAMSMCGNITCSDFFLNARGLSHSDQTATSNTTPESIQSLTLSRIPEHNENDSAVNQNDANSYTMEMDFPAYVRDLSF